MLKERFRFRDAFGLLLAVFGATVVVLSSKSEEVKVCRVTNADLAYCRIAKRDFVQLSPDLVVEYLTSMQAIIYYSITGGLILFLTVLSPKYGSTSILIDLGLVALYGKTIEIHFSRCLSVTLSNAPSLSYRRLYCLIDKKCLISIEFNIV